MMPSSHLIHCHPLLPPSIFPSIRVFSNESALHIRWPKYWSFSFNISPSNEHPGLISFRMGWLDLLAVQGTLKSSHYYGEQNLCDPIPPKWFPHQLPCLERDLQFPKRLLWLRLVHLLRSPIQLAFFYFF